MDKCVEGMVVQCSWEVCGIFPSFGYGVMELHAHVTTNWLVFQLYAVYAYDDLLQRLVYMCKDLQLLHMYMYTCMYICIMTSHMIKVTTGNL